jgi:putative radical SAM-modified peptide
METETSGIVVLDEGIEESADNLSGCCKTGPAIARI